MSITTIASLYSTSSAAPPRSMSSSAALRQSTATTESTTVSISAEARQAAAHAGGIAVPESIRQAALSELNRIFPQDILDEARTRLQANQGIGGSSATPGMGNLPLLPENAALIAQIKSEMHAARTASTESMTNLTPYVQLIHAVQTEGWKAPMTMADAQREVDIAAAMARLTPAASSAPLSEAEAAQKLKVAIAQFQQEQAGEVPAKWKQRWQEAQLSMPETAVTTFPQSIWLGLAKAAGISAEEFLGKARELAGNYTGNTFLQAIERFVSDRYVATSSTWKTT